MALHSSLRPATLVQTTTDDGIRLAGRVWRPDSGRVSIGRSLTYVVAHGFTGSSAVPRVQAICSRLAADGATVVAFDFRGHGESGGGSTLGDVEVHDVAAAVRFARKEFGGPVACAGWSMGGSVVLRHAGLDPARASHETPHDMNKHDVSMDDVSMDDVSMDDVNPGHAGDQPDAVVSVSSPGLWYERRTRAMRVVHWAAETRRGQLVCRVVGRTRLTDGWQVLPASPVEVVAAIPPRPLLIVHGDRDPYFPLRHGRLLAAAAPEADFWLEPDMGHAETATDFDLVDRIDAWVRCVLPGVDVKPRVSAAT